MMDKIITMAHGSGGEETNNLIKDIFYRYLKNDELMQQGDATILKEVKGKIATSIDGFVVNPVFFPGEI